MLQSVFKSGKLLLESTAPEEAAASAEAYPWLMSVLVVVFVLLAIVTLKTFLQLTPYLADSIFRMRGSVALESSVRVSHDRNLIAAVLIIPAVLLCYRYRLYNPSFLAGLDPNLRMAGVTLALAGYLLLRLLIYLWVRPRHRSDVFRQAHRLAYTYFIFLMLLMLPTLSILWLMGVEDATMRLVLLVETGLVFALILYRCAQILSLSCNHLRTFLYLCALEILPAALLVISAVVL